MTDDYSVSLIFRYLQRFSHTKSPNELKLLFGGYVGVFDKKGVIGKTNTKTSQFTYLLKAARLRSMKLAPHKNDL